MAGEIGVGKENIPKIIHQFSNRKHSKYIAVNCGAIPEGTIDSELFGHEKELLLEQLQQEMDILKLQTAEQFLDKLVNFLFQLKLDYWEFLKLVNF